MRPATFQRFLLDELPHRGDVTRVQTLADAGAAQYPYGVAISASAGETRWQIMGQLVEGERHEHQEQRVEGEPAAWADAAPGSGPVGWLASAIGEVKNPEIAAIEPFKGSASEGLKITFHNGARAYVRKL